MTSSDLKLLSVNQINENLEKISDWNLEGGKLISRNIKFKDFNEAVEFLNKVAEVAEQENHHPDLRIYDYNNLEIKLSTHSIGGLTQKDFEVAEKIDKI